MLKNRRMPPQHIRKAMTMQPIRGWIHKAPACALAVFLLAGCAVGPDYSVPALGLPQGWFTSGVAVDDKMTVQEDWWKQFNDPVLDALISKASSGNFDMKIAEARIAQARATGSSAQADLLPTVNVTGLGDRQSNRIAFGDAPFNLSKPFNTFQAGFDASWEIDIFGGKRREIESDTATLKAAEATRDDVRISLIAEVARGYVDIRQYQQQIALVGDTAAADLKTVDIAGQRYRSGNTAGLDVTQAKAQLAQAQTQLPYYQNLLAQAEFRMDVLLGEQPGATHALVADHAPIPDTDKELILTAPASVIANRPDIRVAERQLAAATAQQGVAVAQFFPKISLSGFLGLLNTDAGKLLLANSKSWDAGANVLWPILNYGKLSAGTALADARQQEALAHYQKIVISALSDVEQAATAYIRQQEFTAAQAKTVADNAHAADIAHMRYKEGLSSFIEVLDAQRTLYASQSQLAAARGILAQDRIAVYKSLGGGWKDAPVAGDATGFLLE
jgi:NodT family efflux transporter outer membrane factor (OMF) lipoprotein